VSSPAGPGSGGDNPVDYARASPGLYPPAGTYRDPAVPDHPVAGSGPVPTGQGASRSLGDLIGEITTDLSTLVQQEIALAKAEATQSAKRAGKGAGMFGGAGFAGYFALLFASIALWWAIGDGMGHGWSALIVAALWAIAGAILAALGKKEFAQIRGMGRTTETLGKIPNAVKGNEEENR
jgi:hypothetical protein